MVEARLPRLRPDLKLLPGSHDEDGAPRWLLYDVVSNRYFSLFERTLKLIRHWQPGVLVDEMVASLGKQGLDFDADEIRSFAHFLVTNHLVQARTDGAAGHFAGQKRAQRKGVWSWLLHNYLFIKIPLVRPEPWLRKVMPRMGWLFQPWLSRLIIMLGVIGGFMVLRQWDTFTATFLYFFSLEGMVLYALTLVLVKSAHELGHAMVSHRLGCRVASMGVAFLVMMPVLYTDTTDAWKLRRKKDRLRIVTAGVRTELYIAMLATFLWSVLPDGALRSAAFFLATTSWVTSLLVNVSPFLRFDGYYAFSDLIGVENLQQRGFALGRWKMRQWLWGLRDPMPEPMPRPRARLLILYAWGTWVYRFVLFLGIALLVYHLFFKVLGILLFVVELLWFIAMPIYRELKAWWERKEQFQWGAGRLLAWLIPVALLVYAAIPLPSEVKMPAVVRAAEIQDLFAPEAGRIVRLPIVDGQRVERGEVLLELHSPELEQRLEETSLELRMVNERLSRQASSAEQRSLVAVNEQMLRQLQGRLEGLQARLDRLTLRAPFAGIVDTRRALHEGQWIGEDADLITVHGTAEVVIDGLVVEQDLVMLEAGQSGVFIADSGEHAALPVRLSDISVSAIPFLRYRELASDHGGPVAVRSSEDRLVPESAYYRIQAVPQAGTPPWAPDRRQSGLLVVEGATRSWLVHQARRVVVVFLRETGF
ncbi:HlyD family efflux transporter periplasmic adaptor subunit [Marinobacter lacisalsi]|uniref:HlyD family efflux transporter periplasmic adaptor subunit n=1 Tax=Marinobacter lacisalsi TaxID=475979 RepID=A0ABV8QPE3_9GAMM